MLIKQAYTHRFCVAPMMDWTDKHCRFFHRLLTTKALLYTEMVTTGALIHGDRDRYLCFSQEEHPLALQLGGSNPQELAMCAKMAEDFGYAEVNLNIGCPSDRVQNGRFGACLMLEPALVAECVMAMKQAVKIPVTVKSRIGVDNNDSYAELAGFVERIASAGCKCFIIHARKAWLSGLSPKQNREIPPLNYAAVYQLKNDYPHLEIIINGGITGVSQSLKLLEQVDGIMVGREAYHNPYMLAEVDRQIFHTTNPVKSRQQIITEMLPYIEVQLTQGVRLNAIVRHMLGLYHGQPGGRLFRRYLSEHAPRPGASSKVLLDAVEFTRL